MPQSLANVVIHLVFSTKNRSPNLSPDIRRELYPYFATVFRELESPTIEIGGEVDHVHILFRLPRTSTIAQVVEKAKTSTSKWMKTTSPENAAFSWQTGYGAFSVSQGGVDLIVGYIQGQQAHHRKVSFQDEYRELLGEAGVPFDERYMWD